jgi:C4-dicarboxylate-binding protein DctP
MIRSLRTMFRLIAPALLVAAATVSLPAGPADAAPRTETILTMALILPEGSREHASAVAFKRKVEAATSGRVTLTLQPGSKLYRAPEAVKAIQAKRAEIGTLPLDDLVRDVPAADVFVQPFMFHNDGVWRDAWSRGSAVRRPLDAVILKTLGLRVLWWQSNGPGVILSKGKPVKRSRDLAGRRVQVPAVTLGKWVELCQGKPVEVDVPQVADLMPTGQADMAMTHLGAVGPRRMWEWADTLTLTRHYAGGLVMVVNEQVWQSLPAADRAIIEKIAAEQDRALLADSAAAERADIEAATARRMTVHRIEADDVADWKRCNAALLAQFLSRSGPLGEEVLAGYRAVVVQHDLVPPAN